MADENPTDQGAAAAPNPAKQDLQDQGAVMMLILAGFPAQLRLSDLVHEIAGDLGDFAKRDRVERAVRDLVAVGLLFRCDALVLPTRAAIRFREILNGGGG